MTLGGAGARGGAGASGGAGTQPPTSDGPLAAVVARRRRWWPGPGWGRSARLLSDWLRPAPVSVALAVVVVLVGTLGRAVGGEAFAALAVHAAEPARWAAWLTSTVWTPSLPSSLVDGLLVVAVGAPVERFLGRTRFLTVGLAASVLGVGVLHAVHPLIALLDRPWAEHLAGAPAGGPLGVVVGALAAASIRMDALARRRIHTVLFVWLSALVAFGGGADDIAQWGAALAGVGLGLLAWRGSAPERSLVGTRHDARTILALVVVAVTAGTLLSAWSPLPVGPLAAARFAVDSPLADPVTVTTTCLEPDRLVECAGVTYAARTHGPSAAALAALPLVLQLVMAGGLRLGRRAAALGTIVLQCGMVILAAAHLAVMRWMFEQTGTDTAPLLGLADDGTPSARLIVPLVVPLLLAIQVALHLRSFGVKTRPGTFRRFWGWVGIAVAAGLAIVWGAGLAVADQFLPTATAPLLFADYAVRLLPTGALALVTPTLEPDSAVAVAVAEWVPVAVWVVVTVAWFRAQGSAPAIRPGQREDLAALVRREGAGSLGWMLTWPGNDVWLSPDGRSGFAYRVGSGVALTVTDPATAPDDLRDGLVDFATACTAQSLVPALYSVHAPTADQARALGWATVQVAEEAVIDLGGVTFSGKAFQDVRTALNRATKEGITDLWTTWDGCTPGQRDQVRAICDAWLADKALPEMGFTLGGVAELDAETRLGLAVDAEGTVHGVTSWLRAHRGGAVVGWTLDVMRRREGGFRSTMEFLIARAVLTAQEQGFAFVSLSGSPLARSGGSAPGEGPAASATRLEGVLEVLGTLLEPVYGFRSLLAFKAKFGPRFVPLYLAVPDLLDAPTVGLAIARAYLPDLGAADAARFAQRLVNRD